MSESNIVYGRVCNNCQKFKIWLEFGKVSQRKDGHQTQCKECLKVKSKKWVENNRDKVRTNGRKWAKENRDVQKEWERKNPEKHRAIKKRYADKNKQARHQHSVKRRARLRGALQISDEVNYSDILNRDGYWCYLGNHVINEKHEFDHIDPISRQGNHTMDNIAVTCRYHNRQKGNKTLLEYLLYVCN